MDFSQIPLFALADRRLAWTDQRQQVLAQNIANADTPGWQARDLTPFAQQLQGAGIQLARTSPAHLAPLSGGSFSAVTDAGERSPDGNSVAIDQELTKVADTDSTNELVSALTHTYLGMFRTAIGK
jgi:flagellar basal-body rod protein FlgB